MRSAGGEVEPQVIVLHEDQWCRGSCCLLHDRSGTTNCLRAGWLGGTQMPHGWLGVRLLHVKAGRLWHTTA